MRNSAGGQIAKRLVGPLLVVAPRPILRNLPHLPRRSSRPSRPAARKSVPARCPFSTWREARARPPPDPKPQYPCRWRIRIGFDPQALTDEVVRYAESPEPLTPASASCMKSTGRRAFAHGETAFAANIGNLSAAVSLFQDPNNLALRESRLLHLALREAIFARTPCFSMDPSYGKATPLKEFRSGTYRELEAFWNFPPSGMFSWEKKRGKSAALVPAFHFNVKVP